MKKSTLIFLLIFFGLTLSGQTIYTVNISYIMNKTSPPSYTFSTDFKGEASHYYWYFGDEGVSDSISPTYTFKYTKNYVVNVKIPDKANVVHYGRLEAGFEGISLPTATACKAYFTFANSITSGNTVAPKKVVFTNQTTGEIKECKWTFGDSITSTDRNPVHEFASFGEYKVCLYIMTTDGCKSEYCSIVLIDSLSVSTCNFDLVIKSKDQSTNVFTFYAISKSEIKTWKWNFGDGITSDAQNPDHTYGKTGTYVVTCTIVTSSGCTATRISKLTVSEPSLPVCPGAVSLVLFDPYGNLTVCNGKAIVSLLDTNGKAYEGVNYTWSNGMTGDTAKNLCPNKQYIVHAVIPSVCQKNTSFAFLTSPVWKVESSNGKYAFTVISPSDSIIYRWDFGDGKFAFGTSVEYSYENYGNYDVTLTAISGNYSSESTQKVAVMSDITSVNEISAAKLKVYPNPAKDILTIEFGKPVTVTLNIEMVDMKGQIATVKRFDLNGQYFIQMETTSLPPGMYMLRMSSNDKVFPGMKFQKSK